MKKKSEEILLKLLPKQPLRDNINDPYKSLLWDIVFQYRHRMPVMDDYLKSDDFKSLVVKNQNKFILFDGKGDAFFHRDLIHRLNKRGTLTLPLLTSPQKNLRKKRVKPPTPLSIKTIEEDYALSIAWAENELYRLAKNKAKDGGLEGGDKYQVLKRIHASMMKRAKRFVTAFESSMQDEYIPSKNKMSRSVYRKMLGQTPPENLFEQYINARLSFAYFLLTIQKPILE